MSDPFTGPPPVRVEHTARTALEDLAGTGELAPGRPSRRGRGFYYVPAT